METEIEAKFADVDTEEVRQRLMAAGATLEQPMRDMRRALIEEDHHAAEHAFIRIRDEGDKVTLTYKQHAPVGTGAVDSAREIETTIGNFVTAVRLFQAAGWHYTTYQESRRETWQLGDAEVVIDEWPWIMPYVEVEGPSSEAVQAAAKALGFDWSDALFGSVDLIYQRDFPAMTVRGVIDVKEVRFADPVPVEFGERRQGV